MGCPKRAAAHIGRIGPLAISLGIGTAVITGSGTAWADTTDAGPGGPGASTQQSTSAPTAARAGRGSGSGAHPPHSAGSSAGNQGGSGKGGSSSGSGSASTAAAPAAVTSPVSQSVSRIHARQTAVAVAGTTVPPAAPAPVAVSPVTPPIASPVAVAVPAAAVLQAPHQPVAAAQTVTSPVRAGSRRSDRSRQSHGVACALGATGMDAPRSRQREFPVSRDPGSSRHGTGQCQRRCGSGHPAHQPGLTADRLGHGSAEYGLSGIGLDSDQ